MTKISTEPKEEELGCVQPQLSYLIVFVFLPFVLFLFVVILILLG
jgi:hypothetical protein